jgi:hypothetical protein
MKLNLLWQDDPNCPDNNCPAFYQTDDGRYVVQGDSVDDETRAQLSRLGAGEGAVVLSAAMIERIKKEA